MAHTISELNNKFSDSNQPANYFSNARYQAIGMLPPISSCLEVGCGNGATLAQIKERNPRAWLAGIEIEPQQARLVKAEKVIIGDVEHVDLTDLCPEPLDAVLCLDILEHLRDPWTTVGILAKLLRPGGVMIASLPNVQHYSIIAGLLRGKWQYTPAGLLDRTHLRFFVYSSSIEMFRDAGLTPVLVDTNCSALLGFFNAMTGRVFEGFLANQYLVKCIKGDAEKEHSGYFEHLSLQAKRLWFKLKNRADRRRSCNL